MFASTLRQNLSLKKKKLIQQTDLIFNLFLVVIIKSNVTV